MADIKSTIDRSKDLIIHTVVGKIAAGEILDYLQKFYSSEKPTKNVIWDFTKAQGEDIPSDEILKMARRGKSVDFLRKKGKTGLVFSRDVGYGLGRMYASHAQQEGSSVTYNVFYSMDEALNWVEA